MNAAQIFTAIVISVVMIPWLVLMMKLILSRKKEWIIFYNPDTMKPPKIDGVVWVPVQPNSGQEVCSAVMPLPR